MTQEELDTEIDALKESINIVSADVVSIIFDTENSVDEMIANVDVNKRNLADIQAQQEGLYDI